MSFSADHFTSIINWSQCELHEPLLTKALTREEILDQIKEPHLPTFPQFPCHTQAVESHIKLVNEVSAAVCGFEARDGFVKSRIMSRSKFPKMENKGQLVLSSPPK